MDEVPLRPVVVAPTYNNLSTLPDILARVESQGVRIIVVNDGSTDGTTDFLDQWNGADTRMVVTHPKNRGKAAALRNGFCAASRAGFTHAITIDTDGQLLPEEIPALLEAASHSPDALILGLRDEHAPDYPAQSRIGRRISNLLIRLESGVRVDDSQCGFRVYPLGLIGAVQCRAGHYGFETEIVTRAGWAGCAVLHVPVTCRYLPQKERISHFRPWLDTLRAMVMHLFLLARALCPFPPHRRWPQTSRLAPPSDQTRWRRLLNWISPRRAWRQLRQSHAGRREIAAGLAIGVFIANLPFYGFQSVLSLYTARRLHLHPLSVLLGSHLSTPPIGPLMIAAAIALGHLLLHGALPASADFDPRPAGWWHVLRPLLLEWSVGALILGFFMAVLTFVFAVTLLRPIAQRDDSTVAGSGC